MLNNPLFAQMLGGMNQNRGALPNLLNNNNQANTNPVLNNPLLGNMGNNFAPNINYEDQYKNELQVLEEMGFTNKHENIEALKKTFGNVQAAIERLINKK